VGYLYVILGTRNVCWTYTLRIVKRWCTFVCTGDTQ
jgi:hypothetical protein